MTEVDTAFIARWYISILMDRSSLCIVSSNPLTRIDSLGLLEMVMDCCSSDERVHSWWLELLGILDAIGQNILIWFGRKSAYRSLGRSFQKYTKHHSDDRSGKQVFCDLRI